MTLKKLSQCINLCQFKIGEWFFPAIEPFFRIVENRKMMVRMRFIQALGSLEKNNPVAALASLNTVLSLNPNHFLARVFRGRIYIRERRFRLAAEDYIHANRISRYRFIHYDLYREYFTSINKGVGKLSASIIENFNQAFEMLKKSEKTDNGSVSPFSQSKLAAPVENGEDLLAAEDLVFTKKEKRKFEKLGPITTEEIEQTDWDSVIKDLTSPD